MELIFIAKTILVRNILNQPVGYTYPKRARGLVKHHRAAWLDAESIRLFYSQKGEITMSPKEALLATVNNMSETQIQALLVFLDTFQNHPADVKPVPISVPSAESPKIDPVRAGMMQTLQDRMNALDYSSPNAENVLKELKDMLNMLLRV